MINVLEEKESDERAGEWSEEVRLRLRPQGWKGEERVEPNRQEEDHVCRSWGVGSLGGGLPGGWAPRQGAASQRPSVLCAVLEAGIAYL